MVGNLLKLKTICLLEQQKKILSDNESYWNLSYNILAYFKVDLLSHWRSPPISFYTIPNILFYTNIYICLLMIDRTLALKILVYE